MKKIFSAIFLTSLVGVSSYGISSQCQERCHTIREVSDIEEALECVQLCEQDQTAEGRRLAAAWQHRVNSIMEATQAQIVFPDACGRATRTEALPHLTPIEGLLVYEFGQWQFKTFIPARGGPDIEKKFTIHDRVGEIGTGNAHGDIPLLSLTPNDGWVVMAHVDLENKKVMCLSQAYQLRG